MKIHRVKSPFMSRIGQFEEGKQTLCIGILETVLAEEKIHEFILGGNDKVIYSISLDDAFKYATIWKNKAGLPVFIVPVNKCNRKEIEPEPVLGQINLDL